LAGNDSETSEAIVVSFLWRELTVWIPRGV